MAIHFETGELVAGDFRVERKLGEGGMGAVYVSTQLSVGRRVVLKTLLPKLTSHEDGGTRFRREAQILSQLHHPNIVTMHAFGTTERGASYLIMELIEGRSLAETLVIEGRLSPKRTVSIIRQLLSALVEAHAHEILHRDLKPENIMLMRTADGVERVKVLDFGVAKLLDQRAQSALTADFALVGTPQYMSPEQISGQSRLDARSDLYAVGLIFYELLAGRHPIQAETPMQYLFSQVSQPIVPLRELSEALPESVNAVIMRAVEKNPEARFSSAREMLDALAPLEREALPEIIDVSGAPPIVSGMAATIDSGVSTPRVDLETGSPPAHALARTLPPTEPSARPSEAGGARASTPPWLVPALSGAVVVLIITLIAVLATDDDDGGSRPSEEAPAKPTPVARVDDASGGGRPVGSDAAEAGGTVDVSEVPRDALRVEPPQPDLSATQRAARRGALMAAARGLAHPREALRVVSIAAASHTSFAVMSNGEVRAWGMGHEMALGVALEGGDATTPVRVPDLEGVTRLFAGADDEAELEVVACALTAADETYCWGNSERLPHREGRPPSSPKRIQALRGVTDLTMNDDQTIFITPDPALMVWGSRDPGSYSASKLYPIDIGEVVTAVDVGERHACLATEGGQVWCWGERFIDVLDHGMSSSAPRRVEALEDIVRVEVGGSASCALKQDGRLFCWGFDNDGLEQMMAGVVDFDVGRNHRCLVTDVGMVFCWGSSGYGAIGVARDNDCCRGQPTPVDLPGHFEAVQVAVGLRHSCALSREGEVYCWGSNRFGELGDGTLQDRHEARAVLHLNDPVLPPADNGAAWFDAAEERDSVNQGAPPEGCVKGPLLLLHSSLGSTPMAVRYGRIYRDFGDPVFLIADYHPRRSRSYSGMTNDPRGDARLIRLSFEDLPTTVALRPPPGVYPFEDDGPHVRGSVRTRYTDSGVPIAMGSKMLEGSQVTISRNDGEWICGEIDVRASWGMLQGPFAFQPADD